MSMELLQNHKYEFYELTISYLHEVKTQMESVIELCREGEISVHDVERIISGEFLAAHGVLYDLDQKPTESICHSMKDLAIQQEEISENKKMTDTVFDYIAFLEKMREKELPGILKTDDYQQKRKAKMKTQSNIEHEDKESQKQETTTLPQNSELPVAEPDTAINLPLMGGPDRDELQKQFQEQINELFKDVTNDDEFEKKMDQLEDMYTPKRKILQKSKKKFYGVLDAYIQGTLTKEKALLLLQSKHQQLNEEIKDMAVKGSFIDIDYEDGKGCMPEEFMKIASEVNYYYDITKNNIGNADIKLENFSSPAVKRVVESVSASFDKFFEIAEKKESQPELETQPLEKTPPTQCNEDILKLRNEKILKLKQELNADGSLLNDLITVSSSASLEKITKKYWENFDCVTDEMFTEFICQSRNKPYTKKSIKETIKKTRPISKYKEKKKK